MARWSNLELKKLVKESKISVCLKRFAKKHKRSFASVSAKFYKIRTKNGLYWTVKDVNKLMNLKKNGYSVLYIAKTLKRSIGAISAKYRSQQAKHKVSKKTVKQTVKQKVKKVKQEICVPYRSMLDSLLNPVKIEE
jgi:hypothetical protein